DHLAREIAFVGPGDSERDTASFMASPTTRSAAWKLPPMQSEAQSPHRGWLRGSLQVAASAETIPTVEYKPLRADPGGASCCSATRARPVAHLEAHRDVRPAPLSSKRVV